MTGSAPAQAVGTGWLISQQRLRQLLGLMWLVDGVLQLQPQMFTMNMINGVMVPMTHGQPGIIGRNLTWITQMTTHNLTLVNIVIAVVQVSIGVLLLTGVYVRQAIIASGIWAVAVWYGGEGMSMILTGQASVLTGAPGAVLLYPLLGLAVYPKDDASPHLTARNYAGLLSRHALRRILGGLWIFYALLQLQPYWWHGGRVTATLQSMLGMGGWNTSLIDPTLSGLAAHAARDEIGINLGFIILCLGLGLALLMSDDWSARPVLLASIVASVALWWLAEAFGGLFTGMSTDFNSGFPLVALAVACFPLPGPVPRPWRSGLVVPRAVPEPS